MSTDVCASIPCCRSEFKDEVEGSKFTLSLQELGNVGHSTAGSNSVHTHIYPSADHRRLNDSRSPPTVRPLLGSRSAALRRRRGSAGEGAADPRRWHCHKHRERAASHAG